MSQTKTELYNLAAQIVGGRGRLTTTAQASRYSDVFDTWYDVTRKTVLRASHWPSTRKLATLPLLSERDTNTDWQITDPVPGAKFAYITPSDMLHPRMLADGGHFTLGIIGDTNALFCHSERPILEYTFDQTNIGKWESDLLLTVAYGLAAFSAYTVTGKPQLAKDLKNEANDRIISARNSIANTGDEQQSTVASWHAARGYVGSPTVNRYLFPYGTLFTVGESANVK
jgi:hypothetical protein